MPAAPVLARSSSGANRAACRAAAMMAAAMLALLGACGSDDGDVGNDFQRPPAQTGPPTSEQAACDPVVAEPLDPQSGRHLLPGAPEAAYQTEPPTSGPHSGASLPSGAVREPIPKPKQVGLLEGGSVLVQYRDLGPEVVADVEELADGQIVVVAPNPDLPAPIVFTAWTFKQTCNTYDRAAAETFIADHAAAVGDPHG